MRPSPYRRPSWIGESRRCLLSSLQATAETTTATGPGWKTVPQTQVPVPAGEVPDGTIRSLAVKTMPTTVRSQEITGEGATTTTTTTTTETTTIGTVAETTPITTTTGMGTKTVILLLPPLATTRAGGEGGQARGIMTTRVTRILPGEAFSRETVPKHAIRETAGSPFKIPRPQVRLPRYHHRQCLTLLLHLSHSILLLFCGHPLPCLGSLQLRISLGFKLPHD